MGGRYQRLRWWARMSSMCPSRGPSLCAAMNAHSSSTPLAPTSTAPSHLAYCASPVACAVSSSSLCVCLDRGALWVDRMEYFWNDDRSRVFLALSLRRDHDAAMRSLLGAVDAALVAFGHAPFYADPRPHVSIAWFLPSSTVSSVVPSEATALSRAAELPWRRATVKIGQHVHALNAVTRLDA